MKDPERLVLISRPDKHGGYNGIRYAAFEHLRDHNSVLSGIFGIIMPQTTAVTIDGQAELVNAQIVSGSYYSTLGVSAMLGRTITSQDDRMPEGSSVAVISYGYWQRRLHGVSAVIGKKIAINGFPFTIIGVTPPGFFGLMYGEAAHITVPISLQSVMTGRGYLQDTRKDWFVGSIGGRLKPGMSLENARANLDLVFRQTLGPEQQKGEPQLSVVSGSRGFWLIRDRLATPLVILAAMVGLVLLIACANVANLLMVRNAARRKEIAMRLALGVSRPRLIRQLLTECVLLGVLGGAVGLLVAVWTGELLVGLVSRGPFPISFDFHLDARVLGFTDGVSVLVGVLFGLVPVARATKVDLTIDLKAAGGRGGSPMGFDLGRILIVAQVAVSLLMLVGAGLFVRTLTTLASLFGLLALVQVCVGLFGMMAYRVGWRTQEIGVRMALGAERGNVIRMVLREALLLVSMGVAVGVPVALALARLVASLLYGLKAGDAGTIWAVVGLLVLVAAVASYLPARRASRVDPMAALRCE